MRSCSLLSILGRSIYASKLVDGVKAAIELIGDEMYVSLKPTP